MKHILKGTVVLATISLLGACIEQNSQANDPKPAKELQQMAAQEPVAPKPVPQPAPKPAPKPVAKPQPAPVPLGWLEKASLPELEEKATVKLDSGAKTSSINADIIKTFKRDGEEYVLFRPQLGEEKNADAPTLERKIVRWVRIKKKEGGFLRRPVVVMDLCIGTQMIRGEVNLASRDHFLYPILIGRNMLENRIMIDSSRSYTTKPNCKG